MRHGICAATGALGAALLVASVGVGRTQAELPPDSQQPRFETRFHFPYDNLPAEAETTGSAKSEEEPRIKDSQRSLNPMKELFISPAEAQSGPAPRVPPAAQPGAGTTQSLRKAPEKPLPAEKPAALKKPLLQNRATVRPLATGRAAFYEHPGRTASGEKYNPDGYTAAHKSLPLGTRLRVVNLRNRKSVIVRVNDRPPAKMNFAIDLSRGSAKAIGITKQEGVGLVAIYKIN